MAKWIENGNRLINLNGFKIIRKMTEYAYCGGPKFYIIKLMAEEHDQSPFNVSFSRKEERDREYERIKKMLLEE